MIGRLRTVVFDAADIEAEAQFWSALLDIPIVHRSDDWMTLQDRDVRLAVQLAPDHVPPDWPDPAHPQQIHLDIELTDVDEEEPGDSARGMRSTQKRSPLRMPRLTRGGKPAD